MPIPNEIRTILEPAHEPCQFMKECERCWTSAYDAVPRDFTLWNPTAGWAPRGFCGATAGIGRVELVVVLAEPSRPDSDEVYPDEGGIEAVAGRSLQNLRGRRSRHHSGLLRMLEFFFPSTGFDELFERVLKLESVMCSIPKPLPQNGSSKALLPQRVEQNCIDNYVIPLLRLFPKATIVAAGKKKNGMGDTERRIRAVAGREGFAHRLRYVYHPSYWAQGGTARAEEDWAEAARGWRDDLA